MTISLESDENLIPTSDDELTDSDELMLIDEIGSIDRRSSIIKILN